MNIEENVLSKECTACGACINICPKSCIIFKKDKLKNYYPIIQKEKCIECSKCKKVCHLFNKDLFKKKSENVFVGWSNSEKIRKYSASGGIATEFYRWGIKNKYNCYGVEYTREQGARYIKVEKIEDLKKVRNSKYVYSEMKDIYINIYNELKNNEKVLFIGLPCQVASLITFLGKKYENLIVIDIICHGVCSNEYLDEHLENIEQRKKQKIKLLFFRDPEFGTNSYRFTCKNLNNEYIYNKGVHENDIYQIGYHQSLIYRENCYKCRYAKAERVGDLTIGDFSGLGKKESYTHGKENVSCIIVSTECGGEILNFLKQENKITIYRRPSEEAFLYEKQLREPSIPHKNREKFKKLLEKSNSFIYSAKNALFFTCLKNRIKKIILWDKIRKIIVRILPKKMKQKIKKYMIGV